MFRYFFVSRWWSLSCWGRFEKWICSQRWWCGLCRLVAENRSKSSPLELRSSMLNKILLFPNTVHCQGRFAHQAYTFGIIFYTAPSCMPRRPILFYILHFSSAILHWVYSNVCTSESVILPYFGSQLKHLHLILKPRFYIYQTIWTGSYMYKRQTCRKRKRAKHEKKGIKFTLEISINKNSPTFSSIEWDAQNPDIYPNMEERSCMVLANANGIYTCSLDACFTMNCFRCTGTVRLALFGAACKVIILLYRWLLWFLNRVP